MNREASPSDRPTLVLVEGQSDAVAVEGLAARMGIALDTLGIAIIALGGASAFPAFLAGLADDAANPRISGLYDQSELGDVQRALRLQGRRARLDPTGLESLGFFMCRTDLEDELIRATGTDAVVGVIDSQGDGASFLKLQLQPAWRGRQLHDQLRRFMSSQSGRKARYARLLIDQLEPSHAPLPLRKLLTFATHGHWTGST